MTIQQADYEELLATYSQTREAIALLRLYRPYLELIPSMRRPEDSLITIPLPIAKLRHTHPSPSGHGNITKAEAAPVPCEIALLMCDPEWKVKTGREIFIFIHRPEEDFSELLGRWRQTQVLLSKEYEWLMPLKYQHILNDGAEKIYPLFVLFEQSPERLRRGLKGAHLPCVVASATHQDEQEPSTVPLEEPSSSTVEDSSIEY
ncbi:hypothetical protein [Alkalinema sp. FACHB-956]|uniref:hypothetical protein n=1 Tax=Alkalinema sp. FACHB-956 TaxID=2692768 RepID=UPI0016892965|nr:hypothetical protein [Alkalinema sp. FACHB-956]MBD2325878.1 hypothetical protein [Alkalinema sp. FACHB-956]